METNKQMKRDIINQIVERLVIENKTETGKYIDTFNGMEVIEESTMIEVNSIFASLASYANATQGLEWASYGSSNKNGNRKIQIAETNSSIYFDIPASEAYASIIEGMHYVAEDLSIEDLEFILEGIETGAEETRIFFGRVKEYSRFLIKKNLMASSKKDRTGKQIGRDVADIAMVDDEGNEISYINEKVVSNQTGTRDAVIELFGVDHHNSKIDWIVDNLEDIFTKNQVEYIRGTKQKEMTKQDRSKIRKNMVARLSKKMEKEFGTTHDRLVSIRYEIAKIEKILDAKDFISALYGNTSGERDYEGKATIVDDALAEYCSLRDMKTFKLATIKTPEMIKPLRVALFKKLGELIEAEERWENFTPQKVVGTELVRVYEGDTVVSQVTAKEKMDIYKTSLVSPCLTYKSDKKVQDAINKLESKNRYESSRGVWFSDMINNMSQEKRDEQYDRYRGRNKKENNISKISQEQLEEEYLSNLDYAIEKSYIGMKQSA